MSSNKYGRRNAQGSYYSDMTARKAELVAGVAFYLNYSDPQRLRPVALVIDHGSATDKMGIVQPQSFSCCT